MARRVFYSFYYKPDNWRVAQVREMGVIDGDRPATDNDWEAVTADGNAAIEKWIADQMCGKSCTVVLVGENTAGRKWIKHEITTSWDEGMGVVGIHIHNLKNSDGNQASKGNNPFADVPLVGDKKMSSIVKCYNPPHTASTSVHAHIKNNLADWVEEAIDIRNAY